MFGEFFLDSFIGIGNASQQVVEDVIIHDEIIIKRCFIVVTGTG